MESSNWKQLIVARKDLGMSPGKLAAQVAHGSMAFLTNQIKQSAVKMPDGVVFKNQENKIVMTEPDEYYVATLWIKADLYEGWIQGSFTKVVCEAKNRNHLLKAVTIAEEMGLKADSDYFLIRDNCLTELEPEDEDGRTLTVVGFRPLPADVCAKISRKFQLYK